MTSMAPFSDKFSSIDVLRAAFTVTHADPKSAELHNTTEYLLSYVDFQNTNFVFPDLSVRKHC